MSIEKVAKIINLLDRESAEGVIDYISSRDPPLCQAICSSLFRFEDLLKLEDSDLKTLLQEIPNPLLPIALKGADRQLVDKIIKNMSQRAGAILTEELTMLGPKPRSEVDEAQRTITAVVRLLADQGKIFPPFMDKSAFIR
ncbi:MAG: hypothetical protein HQL70_01480 [Magnetococcales bacterium]|nr:hypothetical protein [Magnetococcales bacterium]